MQPGQPGSQIKGDDFLVRRIAQLERQLREQSAANLLRTAGIAAIEDGIVVEGSVQSRRPDGSVGVAMDSEGSVIAYDEDGKTEAARFGPLVNSAPGKYGVEVKVGDTWVQVGAQVATWSNLAGKPSTFPPSAHTHGSGDLGDIPFSKITGTISSGQIDSVPGSKISGDVPKESVYATDQVHAYSVTGSGTYYQVWVDGSGRFGRNTSSRKYKENIVLHPTAPSKVLSLEPVCYDRKGGGHTEYGLIAEEVVKHLPEIVTYREGEIDGVRYDLLSVALLDVVKAHDRQIKELQAKANAQSAELEAQARRIAALETRLNALEMRSSK